MDDLLHKLVSGALTAGLIALVGALSMAARRRRAAREEAAAQAPVPPQPNAAAPDPTGGRESR
ncbi:hypothetical protein [Streptomyces sp. NPDC057579]|uniref:hypothetical protein n=1 Tax=Streptomyces sp. NPDC057579 TaxID=3346172 RepID=UPI0036A3E9E2